MNTTPRRALQDAANNESSLSADNALSWLDPFGDQVCCILSAEGECLRLSPNWESLTGLTDGECLGQLFVGRMHPDFHPKLKDRLNNTAADTLPKLRCQFAHADGAWHWYDLSLCPIDHAPGERLRGLQSKPETKNRQYLCVMRNISDDVKEQHDLQKAKIEAELALKGRSEFLANMSHELRTPLNAIMGFSEIMKQQMFGRVSNKRYLDYLGNIHESGGQLLSRITDLLEISNIEAGLLNLKEEEIDLAEIIKGAIEMHSHRAFTQKVQVHVQMPDGPVTLFADRVRMTQVIGNLISNAIRFSKNGGKVTVRAALNAEGGLTLSVSDNGKGISQKQLMSIRSILAKENSFYALGREDLGFGLVIAKELLGLQQGTLAIDSKAGNGTKVMVEIPADRVMAAKKKSQLRPRRKLAQAAC